MYHVTIVLEMILWDIVTQSLNKKGKKKCVHNLLFWKLHKENTQIDVSMDLEIKIFFTT